MQLNRCYNAIGSARAYSDFVFREVVALCRLEGIAVKYRCKMAEVENQPGRLTSFVVRVRQMTLPILVDLTLGIAFFWVAYAYISKRFVLGETVTVHFGPNSPWTSMVDGAIKGVVAVIAAKIGEPLAIVVEQVPHHPNS